MLLQITPLILTYNEAPNIERTLSRLRWAKEIVVVDSFSTDETCDLVRKLPQAWIVQREFDSFAQQCNFGLQHIRTPWVLSLDADYLLSEELVRELGAWRPEQGVAGYSVRFRYCVWGRPMRASLYPPRVVLYQKERARYRDEGHGHRVQIEGKVLPLRSVLYHDDRKPLDRWLREQDRYARLEAEHLMRTGSGEQGAWGKAESRNLKAEICGPWSVVRCPSSGLTGLSLADRVRRKIVFAPFLVFIYTLLGKGLIFDGWRGWYYVFQRTLAEIILSLRLLEQKLRVASREQGAGSGEPEVRSEGPRRESRRKPRTTPDHE